MEYKAGKLSDSGVFKVWITGRQVFRVVGNCGGILEETIQKLVDNPKWSSVEMSVIDGEFKGVYVYSKEQTLAMRTWATASKPDWKQRLFPLRGEYVQTVRIKT